MIKNVLAQIPKRARRDSISAAAPPAAFPAFASRAPTVSSLITASPLLPRRQILPVATKNTMLKPITAVENTSAVGFMVQLKKNAAHPYHKACLSPLTHKSISYNRIIWKHNVATSLFAVIPIFIIPGRDARKQIPSSTALPANSPLFSSTPPTTSSVFPPSPVPTQILRIFPKIHKIPARSHRLKAVKKL